MKIVTLVNSTGETSMPYNEFVIYRESKKELRCDQLVISFSASNNYKKGLISIVESNSNIFKFIKNLKFIGKGDIVHIHNSQVGILFFIASIFLPSNKTIFTIHSMFERYSFKVKLLTFLCILFSNKVTLVSKAAFDSLPKILQKFFKRKLEIVVNGVDCDRIDKFVRKNNFKKYENYTVISIGRLVKEKNQQFMLEIISKLPGVELKIIGDGYLNKELNEYCDFKKISNQVFFLGEVSRDRVYEMVMKSHMFISTSRYEGLPIAVLEAIYLGVPCVLSDIPPHKEIKDKIENIDVESINNVEEWLKYFNYSYSKSDLQYNKDLIRKDFSLDKMHNSYNKLYAELERR